MQILTATKGRMKLLEAPQEPALAEQKKKGKKPPRLSSARAAAAKHVEVQLRPRWPRKVTTTLPRNLDPAGGLTAHNPLAARICSRCMILKPVLHTCLAPQQAPLVCTI